MSRLPADHQGGMIFCKVLIMPQTGTCQVDYLSIGRSSVEGLKTHPSQTCPKNSFYSTISYQYALEVDILCVHLSERFKDAFHSSEIELIRWVGGNAEEFHAIFLDLIIDWDLVAANEPLNIPRSVLSLFRVKIIQLSISLDYRPRNCHSLCSGNSSSHMWIHPLLSNLL